jgi:hypothetical protein
MDRTLKGKMGRMVIMLNGNMDIGISRMQPSLPSFLDSVVDVQSF